METADLLIYYQKQHVPSKTLQLLNGYCCKRGFDHIKCKNLFCLCAQNLCYSKEPKY